MKKKISFFLLMVFFPFLFNDCANAQQKKPTTDESTATATISKENVWVDSVYRSLNQEERIGQLFMVAAYSGGANYNESEILNLINHHQIGGLIFMQGTPEKQAKLTNQYQKIAQVPLLIGMDAEWGLGMRLTGVENYPYQMLLGATHDPKLVEGMAGQIAAQCKRLGVHINFAPDVDVNNNPKNPVINFRSFGENKDIVSRLGMAYVRGLQENGIMACAKHFPGHGDVSVDSHLDLPVIKKDQEALEQLEFVPFERMIRAGVSSIMVAHLSVPALDSTPHLPATLSKKIVTGILRNELGFKGLIFTDALNMKGVTKYFPSGEVELKAFLAGNDVLLFAQDVPVAIQKIQEAVQKGVVDSLDLETRVKKVLKAKYFAGLSNFQPIKETHVTEDVNRQTADFWGIAAGEALTAVRVNPDAWNKFNQPKARIAYFDINVGGGISALGSMLKQKFPGITRLTSLNSVSQYDVVLVNINHPNTYPGKSGNYGLTATQISQIKTLAKNKNVGFLLMGNAYLMKFLCGAQNVLVAYQDNQYTEAAVIDALSGNLTPSGRLPVTVCGK